MRFLLLLVLHCFTLSTYAQLEKGTWWLSGSASNIPAPPDLVTAGVIGAGFGNDNFTGVRMSPAFGVAVTEGLLLGARITAAQTWRELANDGQFGLSPFARYYFGATGARTLPFVTGTLDYNRFGTSLAIPATDRWGYRVGAGAALRLNEQITLESVLALTDPDLDEDSPNDLSLSWRTGFTAFLAPSVRMAEAAPFVADGRWVVGTSSLRVATQISSGTPNWSLALAPSVQYFLTEQLAVGGQLFVGRSRSGERDAPLFTSTSLTLTPTVRYYPRAPQTGALFIGAGLGYQYERFEQRGLFSPDLQSSEFQALSVGINAGQHLFLTDRLALEYGPRLALSRRLATDTEEGETAFRVNLEIGLQYFL